MAVTLNPTGPYQAPANANSQYNVANYSFCSAEVLAPAATYAAVGDPSVMDFGAQISQLFIFNTGATPLAFQWKENWDKNTDNGFVPANSYIVIRDVPKGGVRVRGAGGTTTCIVWGL